MTSTVKKTLEEAKFSPPVFDSCPHLKQILTSNAKDTVYRNYGLAVNVALALKLRNGNIPLYKTSDGSKVEYKKLVRLRNKAVRCRECLESLSCTYFCLQCSHVGCWKNGHALAHTKSTGHVFGIDSQTGYIFCFRCGDYVGDQRLELIRQSKQGERTEPIMNNLGTETIIDGSRPPSLKASTGLRGFINMGATCFMSSIVQTIVHNPFVRDYFLSGYHAKCPKKMDTCITCCIDEIFKVFYGTDETKGYGPTALLTAAWRVKNSLAGYSEQDAHEFWQFLLDEIHKSDTELHPELDDTSTCRCITHKTFAGQLQSTVTCEKCLHSKNTVDPMLDLSLEIAKISKDKVTLNDCLDLFTSKEKLDSMTICSHCKKETTRTKQLLVRKLPPILAFQLKRFEHSASSSTKIETHVGFPLFLDMEPYTVSETLNSNEQGRASWGLMTYQLFAIVIHIGSVNTGHYICIIKNRDGNWFKFDDSRITLVSQDYVSKSNAYLLYYILCQA
ncbi:hypothetical protein LJB42_002066 [Komagataella kurtzmanii]|nr:hypothetical protein LJB42_002066 [Komagataella kurtzmanii]